MLVSPVEVQVEAQNDLAARNDSDVFTDQEKRVLTILEAHLPIIEAIHSALNSKAQYNFTLMSSVAGIVSAVILGLPDNTNLSVEIQNSLKIFGVCYLGVALLSAFILFPFKRQLYPLEPTWDAINTWRRFSPQKYRIQLFASYAHIYKSNAPIMKAKGIAAVLSHILVGAGITALLAGVVIYITSQ